MTRQGGSVVRTPRLAVRPPRPGDAPALSEMAADWEVAKQTVSVPHPYEASYAQSWIADSADAAKGARWVIERQSDAVLVGVIGFGGPARHNLGFWLGRAHWGQGFATEAVTAVAEYALDTMGVDKLVAGVFAENPASARVLEKAGFTEGEPMQRTVEHRGGLRDVRRFERARAESE